MVTGSSPPRRGSRALWIRWSLRDLRRHWVAVVAIALVLAIGTGVYAGLGSTASWRRQSNDASFAALRMHDLRVSLSPGTFTEQGDLVATVGSIGSARSVAARAERLVVDSQLRASGGRESILVPARLVGMDVGSAGSVDRIWLREGTRPDASAAHSEAVLEAKFAAARDLGQQGTLTVAGRHEVDYVGLGIIPEDFFYEGPEGSILSEGELAPVYLPLVAAQRVAGRPGEVNDLVVTLEDGADRDLVESQLASAVEERGLSATITTRDDADAVRLLYEDIDNDQRFWNALATLVLFAAAIAAFNLISRIVEAQRREIGVGMALGAPWWKLAVRPMLVGTEVAVLGTLAGVAVGLLVGSAMGGLLKSFLPLPVHRSPFQPGIYARAALLGLALPLLASALPVWRTVRVEPIDAIRTGHLTARSNRLTDWTARLRLPGSSLTHMPIRNIVRSPRRSILTAVGVGAAITALVAVLGMLDSFGRTIDAAGAELTKGNPDRILIQLDTFYPTDSPTVAAITEAAGGTNDTGLRLPATALGSDEGDDLELLVELVDLDAAAWTPTIESSAGVEDGIVLAAKAADDLGVRPGDTVRLRHPVQRAPGEFDLVDSEVRVAGIHANPLRAFAYMDAGQAGRFGLAGTTNIVSAHPSGGTTRTEVQTAVFGLPGVASSQAMARISEGFDEALEQFVGFLVVAAAAVLALALLIAFNATSISVDERRRELATMRAFGLPVRSVMGVIVKESVVLGVAATAIGLGVGALFLEWMLRSLAATTLPDLGIERHLSLTTLVVALAVGVVAVAAAPLLLVRRVRRMDIPDSLRVME